VKGFDLLLESFAQIIKQVPKAVLLLVGDGPERAHLEATAHRLGLAPQIRFVGQQANVVPYYQAMDVYVNSSHSEGISNGILEALACGVPVVGTSVGGTPEILRSAAGGAVLIPPNDPGALTAALRVELANEHTRPARRDAARQAIRDYFSLQRMISQYESLYREVGQA
jgi:glycosyltransferase involved in cell wall biosynthesis